MDKPKERIGDNPALDFLTKAINLGLPVDQTNMAVNAILDLGEALEEEQNSDE